MLLQITLSIISVAGFGLQIPWRQDQFVPAGHQMTYQKSLHIISKDMLIKLLLPNWGMSLTKRTREVETAFSEFKVDISQLYMYTSLMCY